MIRKYFSIIQKKLEEIKWLISEQTVGFDVIADDMGIIRENYAS